MIKKHYCIPLASSLFAPCQSLGIPLPMCWHLLIPISIPISIFIRILINYIKFALQTCCTNFVIIMSFRLHRMNPYSFILILNYCVKDFATCGGSAAQFAISLIAARSSSHVISMYLPNSMLNTLIFMLKYINYFIVLLTTRKFNLNSGYIKRSSNTHNKCKVFKPLMGSTNVTCKTVTADCGQSSAPETHKQNRTGLPASATFLRDGQLVYELKVTTGRTPASDVKVISWHTK